MWIAPVMVFVKLAELKPRETVRFNVSGMFQSLAAYLRRCDL